MSRNRKTLTNLNELGRVEPDSLQTQRAIFRVRAALKEPAANSISLAAIRVNLIRPRNLVGIAAALVAITFAAHWIPQLSSGNFAFAQVQETVGETKSVEYTQSWKRYFGEKLESEDDHVVAVSGTALRDEETGKGQFPDGRPNVWHSVEIRDPAKPKWLILYPDQKQFFYKEELFGIVDGKLVAEKIRPDTNPQFYESIRRVPTEKAVKLPEKSINGRNAVGFLVEETMQGIPGNDRKTTYWVDVETKLPIRIEQHDLPTSISGSLDIVTDNIVFDKGIDPGKFGFEPPAGWEDITEKVLLKSP